MLYVYIIHAFHIVHGCIFHKDKIPAYIVCMHNIKGKCGDNDPVAPLNYKIAPVIGFGEYFF